MHITKYCLSVESIPVDFQADPDGLCDYDLLVTAAGLDPDATPPALVGALSEPWRGHPAGAAVVGAPGSIGEADVAVIECADAPSADVCQAA